MTLKPNDFWYTPKNVWDAIDSFLDEYGDPCPANPTFNGLEEDWEIQDFYINPPYSKKLKRAFINKAIKEYSGGRYLWMFNYANSQDLATVHRIASATLIPFKRFEFVPGHPLLTGHPENPDPEKRNPGSPQYDNIMILWGDTKGFQEAFGHLGFIYFKPSKES